jgi:hypothetical protein
LTRSDRPRGAAAEPRPERTTEPTNEDLEVLCATQVRKNESVWGREKIIKDRQQH